ncbi:hypothetical protein LINPERHAP1_LOCUS31644, partial [Linum perenne]
VVGSIKLRLDRANKKELIRERVVVFSGGALEIEEVGVFSLSYYWCPSTISVVCAGVHLILREQHAT